MNQASIANLIKKGNKFKREGQLEAAIEIYQRCIEANPSYAWYYYYLGEALLELNKWDEAIPPFRKAVKLNPYSSWFYHRLGEGLLKLGKFDEAEANLSQACELSPDNYQFYKGLAWLYRKKKQWNKAINCYSKAIELNPKDCDAYYWYADVFQIKGELNKAIAVCRQGLENYPNDPKLSATLESLKGAKKADKKKEKIIICAIFKDEASYILEWIAYHKAINVDSFIIYDNGSSDGTTEILQGLEQAGVITHIKWPNVANKNPQISAYEDAIRRLKGKCEWIGFIDADEFIVLGKHNDIHSFLNDYQDVDGIAINWKLFGSSGHAYVTDGLVIERFTKSATSPTPGNHQFKTIAKIDSIKPSGGAGVHICRFKAKKPIYVYADRTPVPPKSIGAGWNINHKIVQINHYFTKSKLEWNLKVARGRGDKPVGAPDKKRPMEMFYENEERANAEEDFKIQRWVEDTKKELKVLRSFVELEDLKAQVRFAKAILRESQLEMGPGQEKLLQTEQQLYQTQRELNASKAALSKCQEEMKKM